MKPSPPPLQAWPTDQASFRRRIVAISLVSFASLLPGAWGSRWDLAVLAVTFALRVAVSARFGRYFESERPGADLVGAAFQVSVSLVQSHAAHWSLAAWLTLPLGVLLADGFKQEHSWRRTAVALVATPAFALADGQGWEAVATFTAYTLLFFLVVEGRGRSLREAYDSLAASHVTLRQTHEELKQLQAHLVRQEKLSSLGMLAAGIAHEINNPMAFVTSNLALVSRELRAAMHEPELLEELEADVLPATLDGIKRVNTIVSDLRRFARGDAESAIEYDLNHEISAALRIAHNELKQRCRVELHLGELPKVLGRPQQVTQVLVNLFVNAAQAMAERPGVLTVSSWREGADVVVTVADTGHGMSADTLRQLFQPFFTTKPVGVGTGLGLAVAHGIAAAHGGELSVTSEQGVGSTFRLQLPIRPKSRGGKRTSAFDLPPVTSPTPSPAPGRR